jgi:zinc/manganese transport system ATP-binding protein
VARHLDGGYAPIAAVADREAPDISLAELTISYSTTVAVEAATCTFPSRSMSAIVGPNGAGKSTLLKAIAGIIRPRTGTLSLCRSLPSEIAYLPQSNEVDRDFPVSLIEFVSLGRWRQFGAFRPAYPIITDAAGVLALVGLGEVSDRPIAALSEGQFRRALFARMALQGARVLLLDEPFAGIDEATTADLVRLLERWHRDGCSIIAVLHDLSLVRNHFPLTVLLARRVVAVGETGHVLTAENLAKVGLGTTLECDRSSRLAIAR